MDQMTNQCRRKNNKPTDDRICCNPENGMYSTLIDGVTISSTDYDNLVKAIWQYWDETGSRKPVSDEITAFEQQWGSRVVESTDGEMFYSIVCGMHISAFTMHLLNDLAQECWDEANTKEPAVPHDQVTQDIINALANRINVLEREVRGEEQSAKDEYGMSYDFAVALNEANETIARLEEIIDEKDEQIEELMHRVELYASRRICGVWSL